MAEIEYFCHFSFFSFVVSRKSITFVLWIEVKRTSKQFTFGITMMESSNFMPLGNATEWSTDTATCHLSRCVVEGKCVLKKSLQTQFLDDTKMRTCLRKEYETGCLLAKETPYVVNYHQLIDTEEECTIIMDFVNGKTLDAFIQEQPLYFLEKARLDTFVCQLLDALEAIHHAQVIHLDIKPTNLLLTSVNKELRIIDFGLSYIATFPNTEGMTASFAAPEQKFGSGEVDGRADIYAVGKILEYIEVKEKESCKSYRLPEALRKLKTKCLENDAKNRWQTVTEMRNFLLSEERKKKERKVVGGIVGIVALLCLAVFAYMKEKQGPMEFVTDNGQCYRVVSKDSLTCSLIGRADTCRATNLYIDESVAFQGKDYSVVSVGDSAFLGDKKLISISFPNTLRKIGICAFRECNRLKVVDIPDNVTEIGRMAFWGCTSMTSAHLPMKMKHLPSSCFSKTALVKIDVPEGILSIGYDAFGVCTKLQEVKLPKSLKALERGVFWRCTSLKKIRIPSSVREIGQFCLMECDALHDVYNASVTPQRTVRLFGSNVHHVTLHVPAESIAAYEDAECWRDAKAIVPLK